MVVRTTISISEESKRRADDIKTAITYLRSFGAVVEYCITHVHNELATKDQ